MSRVIDVSDVSKLTDDDIKYLQDRGRLPAGVEPIVDSTNVGHVQGPSSAVPREVPAPDDEELELEEDGYEAMKVADLKAEIERRNADRPADDQLSTKGRHADLVATLVADDEEQGA